MTATPPTPLKLALAEQGITNRALANHVDVSEKQMSLYVNGLRPPADKRGRIAKALGKKEAVLWPT